MQICHTITELRDALRGTPMTALVPTMGNLHEGHIALVREAKQLAAQRGAALGQTAQSKVVVSIFVNRLQFGAGEDFDRYPRTFEADCAQLRQAGTDIVFAPDEHVLYPQPQTFVVEPDPALANILEGQSRPGHFRGVCTVVMKLFACVEPDIAFFGKKDYQQLMILTRMVEQFALRVQPIGLSTVRAPDGLALSSRNGYLSPQEREQAPQLYRALSTMREQVLNGNHHFAALEQAAMQELSHHGWVPDYISVRKQADLQLPSNETSNNGLVIVAAVKLGRTRLIDNLEIS